MSYNCRRLYDRCTAQVRRRRDDGESIRGDGVPGSRLACAVRRRWPARAAEKGAGGVPRAVVSALFPTA